LWVFSVPSTTHKSINIRSLLSQRSNNWSQGTIISFPNSTTFDNSTTRWSTYDAPSYLAAISPANEADVAKTVHGPIFRSRDILMLWHRIPFLATGGRHGYTTTLRDLQGGLAIDLSQLKSYSIDRAAGTLTIGGATTLGDFQDALYEAGRQNRDLFWGLRGAGANLGVVVSASYQAHKLVNQGQILNADLIFPANKSKEYFDVLHSFIGKMPAKLAIVSLIVFDPVAQAAQIVANWVYIGPREEGLRVMAPVLALNPPVTNIQVVPWNKLAPKAAGGADALICPKNSSHNTWWANLRRLPSSTLQVSFDELNNFYKLYPEARGTTINAETFPNQAMAAVPDDDSAYPWRDALGYIQIGVVTESGNAAGDPAAEAGNSLARRLRDSWAATSGYPDLSVYVNYARGDEKLRQRYGSRKLPRLAALKKKYDPRNVFAYNNVLPMEYSG
ncbi:MAG: hypothetical protein Q9180_006446, partial [Flavoplaca navasiana]